MPQQPFGPWVLAFRAALAVILAVSAGAAHAFVICFELPEETLTDRAWAADAVVLAWPDPDARGDFTLAPQVADMLVQARVADPATTFRLKSYLAASRSGHIDPLAAAMQDQR